MSAAPVCGVFSILRIRKSVSKGLWCLGLRDLTSQELQKTMPTLGTDSGWANPDPERQTSCWLSFVDNVGAEWRVDWSLRHGLTLKSCWHGTCYFWIHWDLPTKCSDWKPHATTPCKVKYFFLNFWVHPMYFDHIYPRFLEIPIFLPTQRVFSFSLFKPMQSNSCCPDTLECGTIFRNVINLWRAPPLKTDAQGRVATRNPVLLKS